MAECPYPELVPFLERGGGGGEVMGPEGAAAVVARMQSDQAFACEIDCPSKREAYKIYNKIPSVDEQMDLKDLRFWSIRYVGYQLGFGYQSWEATERFLATCRLTYVEKRELYQQ